MKSIKLFVLFYYDVYPGETAPAQEKIGLYFVHQDLIAYGVLSEFF